MITNTKYHHIHKNATERRLLKRIAPVLTVFIALSLLLSFASRGRAENAANASTKKAENVSFAVKIQTDSGKGTSNLTDADRSSKVTFSDGDTLRVAVKDSSEAKLAGVYVIWDDPPGNWTLETGGQTLKQGTHRFIHEYVELPGETRKLTMHIPAGAVVCDIYFYTDGILPASVQVWQEPWEQADFLLFPTHGDDEHLFFGGIMPYYGGELGFRVQVAYMTDHALTEKYRVHEQLDGLWTVGIRAYPVYGGFVDEYSETLEEAKEMYGSKKVEAWQVEMIRRFKPQVIVGHDFEGEYGHGAHRINGTMLQKSVPDAADPEKFPESAEKYGVWDTPKFYSHLYNRDNGVIMDWENIKLSKFGGETALEMAKKGYKCHESQQWMRFKVKTDGYGDCRQFGLYRSTVGEDVKKNDLLENLVVENGTVHTATPVPTATPTPSPTPEPTATPTATPVPTPSMIPEETVPAVTLRPDGSTVEPGANVNTPVPGGMDEKSGHGKIPGLLIAGTVIAAVGAVAAGAYIVAKLRARSRNARSRNSRNGSGRGGQC